MDKEEVGITPKRDYKRYPVFNDVDLKRLKSGGIDYKRRDFLINGGELCQKK